ncbi:MAG: hypothetical protein QF552_11430 [Litorilituus sp.]|jgi:hypothetical protein|nr:hypothetical protein [Litorilituus sp.]
MKKENSPLNEDQNNDLVDSPMLDEQWLELTEDWQSQPYEKTDIKALLKQTRRRTYWAKALLALNVLATLGMLLGFFYGLSQGRFGTSMNTFLGICGVLSTAFVIYEIKIRFTTWQNCCDSPDKAIDSAIAGCESSLKYIVLTKLAFLPFWLLANWFFYSISIEESRAMWPSLIFINVYLVICYLVTERFHRKRKKEYKQLLSMKSK